MTAALQTFEQPTAVAPSASEFATMKEMAGMLIKSKFLPQSIQTPEQAVAIILTGRELGIGTMAALNNINVIQGKPTVSPQLMLALIERSGQLEDIKVEQTNEYVGVCMKRKGRTAHSEVFGDKEAQAMGLLGKDNYKKQKLTMYRWRAIAACARVVFPDVITGLYTPDELGAEVNDEGQIQSPPKAPLQIAPTPEPDNSNAVDAEVLGERVDEGNEPDTTAGDEQIKKMRARIRELYGAIQNLGGDPGAIDIDAITDADILIEEGKAAREQLDRLQKSHFESQQAKAAKQKR